MKHPGHPRQRALTCLLAVVLAPVTVAIVPTASAEEPGPRAEHPRIAPADPLLDGPARGRAAIRQLGDQLPAAAARNELRPDELRTLLRTDDAVWVDPAGSIYYVDPVHQDSETTAEPAASSQVAPIADTFALHSNPGASRTILLDFDGAYVAGSWWNEGAMPVLDGTHPAWDPAGDGPAFSDGERLKVQQVWAMVAEDYAPFDVDVTTEDPGDAGMVRTSSSDAVYGTRVLVTPSDDPFLKICERQCGGVAYLNVFDRLGSPHQPAWVFPQALGDNAKSIAEAASHEAGHNLGLDHDATTTQNYYAGHGIWAPIMGVGYQKTLVQWSAGSYAGADNQEDDLGILTAYLGARADEASGSITTPSALPVGEAYIGRRDDVDSYLLGSCTAGSVVEVLPAAVAPNLDTRATLHDAAGTQRAVSAPASGPGDGITASGLGGTLTVPTDGDQWVVTVDGAGNGTWADGGYDDYGSLGAYTIRAPGCDVTVATGVPSAPRDVAAGSTQADALALGWSAPATEGDGPVTSYVVTRSGSAASVTLPSGARSHTFTGLTAGTSYQLSVRAVNATGAGPTVTVSATTSPPTPAVPSAPRTVAGSYDPALDTLNVSWVEPESSGTQPITGYAITLNGAGLGLLDSTSRGVTIHSSEGFAAGSYVVDVAAVSAVGRSPVATTVITVVRPSDDATPAATAPTQMKPPTVVVRGRRAIVRWQAAQPNGSPVTRYLVDISRGRDKSLRPAARKAVFKLKPGRYRVRVAARSAVGRSPYSRWVRLRIRA